MSRPIPRLKTLAVLAALQGLFWAGYFLIGAVFLLIPGVSTATDTEGLHRYGIQLAYFLAILSWALTVFTGIARLLGGGAEHLGLQFDGRWWRQFAGGLGLGALLISAIFGVQLALGWVEVTGGWRPLVLGVPLAIGLGLSALIALTVGAWEEIVFRAGLIPRLARVLTSRRVPALVAEWLAVGAPAFAFGLAHLANDNASVVSVVALSIAGLFTGLIYVRTRSLALPIGAHAAWNFFQSNVYGFPLSGEPAVSTTAITIRQSGPSIWTGGEFGPEAGLLCLIAVLAATAVVFGTTRRARPDGA